MSNDTHSVSQETGGDDSFCDHVIECALNLFPVLYGYLLPGMLYWGYRRVSPDGVGSPASDSCEEGLKK